MADAHLSRAELEAWRDNGDGERDQIVGHLATCAPCRHLAAEVERERPPGAVATSRFQPEEFAPIGRRAAGAPARASVVLRPVVYLAAAASLVLAVVLFAPEARPPYAPATRGSAAAVVPLGPKDAAVSVDALTFTWETTPTAGTLRLVVTPAEGAGSVVLDRTVTGTRYTLTDDERERFARGRDYYWFVEYGGAGSAAGTSAAARFRIE